MKSNRNWYRYAEHALYQYMNNIEDMTILQNEFEYLTSHGDLSDGVGFGAMRTSGGEVSDRVLDYVHSKHMIERRIKQKGAELRAVEYVYRKSREPERKIIEGLYFAGKNATDWEGMTHEEFRHAKYHICLQVWRRIVKEYYG